MKRKSKGRVEKFESKNPTQRQGRAAREFEAERYDSREMESAYDADNFGTGRYGTDEYDIQEFLAEGWRNVEREDALRDRAPNSYYTESGSSSGYYTEGGSSSGYYPEDAPEGHDGEDNILPMAGEKAPYDAVQIQRPKKEQRKKNPSRRRRRLAYWAVVLAILITVGFTVQRLVVLRMEQQQLIAEQEALEQQKKDLKEELKLVNDPEYIEKQAREQLHLIKPGEILYVMPEGEDATEQTNQ